MRRPSLLIRLAPALLGLSLLALAATAAPIPEDQPRPAAQGPALITARLCSGDEAAPRTPRILAGYGKGGFPIRTAVPAAQAYFDNGMQLAHAFAHGAAMSAFAEAVRLDPTCAACLWGDAWASGPTINYPAEASALPGLADKVARARALAAARAEKGAGNPQKEMALIEALALRYPAGRKTTDDRAFAAAMDKLADRWPDDDEILVIAADAWMISDFNDERDDHLRRAAALLEQVLKRDPDFAPAIHFYIHVTEALGEAGRAEAFADRLSALAPAASHLIHMPSHTYYHVGRYQDAVTANIHAVAIGRANARRLGLPEPDGVWNLPYFAHNVQYGVGAALISGDSKSALALSNPIVARAAQGKARNEGPFAQMVAGTAYFAKARFDDPQAVLAMPAPARKFPYALAYWHYARGEALARSGTRDAERAIRTEIANMPTRIPAPKDADSADAALRLVHITRLILIGRAATIDNRLSEALAAYRRAARLQESGDFPDYADPPAFWYPIRRDIAATLLTMGRTKEALAEADAALKAWPKEPETERIKARLLAMLSQNRLDS